ncbi:MAG: outer membrane protein assembly factor BamD [Flavisolibacter sp.]
MKFLPVVLLSLLIVSCQSVNKVLKNPDPHYKLRMAEQYYAKKQYGQAQIVFEDIMPYFRGTPEFENIYYKYAYTAYYQKDYLNAENLFKNYLEIFPKSPRSEEMEYMRAYTFYKQSPKSMLDQTATRDAIGAMQTFINTHPGSERNKEATAIIDELRAKLEKKDKDAAQLYYDLGQFRAAATAFNTVLNTYPESDQAEFYKLMAIRSYFRYAELSVEEKRAERFETVVEECNDFIDRFPDSALTGEVEKLLSQSQDNLKIYTNEPSKTTTE